MAFVAIHRRAARFLAGPLRPLPVASTSSSASSPQAPAARRAPAGLGGGSSWLSSVVPQGASERAGAAKGPGGGAATLATPVSAPHRQLLQALQVERLEPMEGDEPGRCRHNQVFVALNRQQICEEFSVALRDLRTVDPGFKNQIPLVLVRYAGPARARGRGPIRHRAPRGGA